MEKAKFMEGEIGELAKVGIDNGKDDVSGALLDSLAKRLNVDSGELNLTGVKRHLDGEGRYIYGLVEEKEGESGLFLKIGDKERLTRESSGMEIASQLGFPVVGLIVPAEEFQFLGRKEYLMVVSKLNGEKGLLSVSPEQLVDNVDNPERNEGNRTLVEKVSKLLVNTERFIPQGIDTENLNKGDWRNVDKEHFLEVWREGVNKVLDGGGRDLVLDGNLEEIIKRGEAAIGKLLEITPKSDYEYLAHNDLSPNNCYVTEGNDIVVLDWEHAGTTHYENLAVLTDMANFWARCWSNPELQKKFINDYLVETVKQGEDLSLAYLMMETTIIHGSLFLAKYGMDPDNREHRMSEMLLKNLKSNLDYFEETKSAIDQHF